MTRSNLTPDEATARAAKLADRGQVVEAAQLYQQVLRAQPGHKKARKALKALQGKQSGAQALTEQDFQRVAQLMAANRLDAARTEIQRLCRLHPEQPALHNLHGVILSRRGEKDAALNAFQEALRQEPAFAEALNNLASTLSDLKHYKKALGCYQELVNRGQADAEVYFNLSRALHGAGQIENAEEALKRAIKLRPLYPDAYNALGNLLNDIGRHDEAVEAYESALQMSPQHRKALQNLGLSLSKMRRHTRALEVYRALIDREPGNIGALRGMADALSALGQRTAAVERYQQVLQLAPDDAIARHFLSALKGETPVKAAPEYARALFESYAANFEGHLTKDLAYDLPERIPALLEKLDGEDAWYASALDLGCGTGLVGAQLRSYCDRLVGVDIADAMVRKAEEKAVYDELVIGEIEATLASGDTSFDLVVCTDVVIYIGDIANLLSAVRRRCDIGASLVLSTELLDDGSIKLRPSGRFAHSEQYIADAAATAGFAITHTEHIPLRKEKGNWLTGGLYVLKAA